MTRILYLSSNDFITLYKGIIPKTLPSQDPDQYDFVHLDLDLYEGTIAALNYFYPRLNNHGNIQIDDYNIHLLWEPLIKILISRLLCCNIKKKYKHNLKQSYLNSYPLI